MRIFTPTIGTKQPINDDVVVLVADLYKGKAMKEMTYISGGGWSVHILKPGRRKVSLDTENYEKAK